MALLGIWFVSMLQTPTPAPRYAVHYEPANHTVKPTLQLDVKRTHRNGILSYSLTGINGDVSAATPLTVGAVAMMGIIEAGACRLAVITGGGLIV